MVYRLQWAPNSMIFSVDAEDGAGYRTLRTVTSAGSVPDVPRCRCHQRSHRRHRGGTPTRARFRRTLFSVDWVRVTQ